MGVVASISSSGVRVSGLSLVIFVWVGVENRIAEV